MFSLYAFKLCHGINSNLLKKNGVCQDLGARCSNRVSLFLYALTEQS